MRRTLTIVTLVIAGLTSNTAIGITFLHRNSSAVPSTAQTIFAGKFEERSNRAHRQNCDCAFFSWEDEDDSVLFDSIPVADHSAFIGLLNALLHPIASNNEIIEFNELVFGIPDFRIAPKQSPPIALLNDWFINRQTEFMTDQHIKLATLEVWNGCSTKKTA